jgi:hypothetical protein
MGDGDRRRDERIARALARDRRIVDGAVRTAGESRERERRSQSLERGESPSHARL